MNSPHQNHCCALSLNGRLCSCSPQCVPIPAINMICKSKCCEKTCIPLALSFARTIDTFQGQTAGPTEPGKPPNDVERIILDPGNRSFEARGKTGLFYTQFSRGSTIGTLKDGKRVGSALYFYDFGISKAPSLRADRIAKLRGPTNNPDRTYLAIQRRDRWIAHIQSNNHGLEMPESDKDDILQWAVNTRIPPHQAEAWLIDSAKGTTGDVA